MEALNRDRWPILGRHLDEAFDLDDEQRAAWLASIRAHDPSLAEELQKLLEEHRELDDAGFLEQSPVPAHHAGLAGQAIGAYTLLQPIGHGGMGSVWLAERSDGRFVRRVAMKFLNVSLMGRGEERFVREGALLARLTHPHIAGLLDAGVSDTGQPYLILEYVDGEPVDRYCLRLSVEQRIRLLLDVLAAVAHAHANLIVHRDIKPSNVLVDRDGQVKLLDFGIAKLLNDNETGLTLEGGVGMTPEYAAPEQMIGDPVTTATDVYALGVLAYQLLSGRHPSGDTRHSAADILKAVVETEPQRLSAAAPSALRRQLRGDLDTIVGKMLRKKPAERYASAIAVADDFTRYLRHEPISARPETVLYRSQKFLRRNWLGAAASMLIVTALSTGLFAANRQRLVAERRFRQLRQLSNRVIALDRSIKNLSGSTLARRTLVADSLEYLEGLAADASGDLDLALELGEGYWRIGRIQGVPTELNLGDFRGAEASLSKAGTLVDRVLASRPQSRAALYDAAEIAHDRMIIAQSERRDADARVHAAHAAARIDAFVHRADVTPEERDQLDGAYGNIALAYSNMHLYAQAETYARQAASLATGLPKPNRRAQALSLLANILRHEGDMNGAVQAITEARTIAETAPYADETERMIDLYGVLLREGMIFGEDGAANAGRPADAIEALKRALDLSDAAAERDPNDWTSRSHVGTAARELGNILRARDPLRAVAVYDLGIKRLGQIPDNVKARRDEAVLLASSSYPLRALGRGIEASQRIELATTLLRRTKDLPPNGTPLPDDPASKVTRAQADDLAAQSKLGR